MINKENCTNIPLGIKMHNRNGLCVSFSPCLHKFHLKVTALSNGITVFDNDIIPDQKPINFNTIQTFYVPWQIEITQAGQHIYLGNLDLTGKQVCINTLPGTLGEIAAWMPEIAAFQIERNCRVTVLMATEYITMFAPVYQRLMFIDQHYFNENDYYAIYPMGIREDKDLNHAPTNVFADNPMLYAANLLNAPAYMDEAPMVAPATEDCAKKHGKYVCIAVGGAKKMNEWLCEGGWDAVVADFTKRGFKVFRLDAVKECATPKGVEDMSALTWQEKLNLLYGCDCFVGVSGDYAWLAYCCEKKVYLISGCTSEHYDVPHSKHIMNTKVCCACASHGAAAFNEYEGCPSQHDYECSRNITAEDVIKAIHAK